MPSDEQRYLEQEIVSLHGRLADSERTITEMSERLKRRTDKLVLVEAILDEHGQWYSGPLLYRTLCEALGVEPK